MSNYKVYKLFPTPIFHLKLDNHEKLNLELEEYILDLKKKDAQGQSKSNRGGWHSKNFNMQDETPKKFINSMKDFLQNVITQDMGWEYNSDKVSITAMWSIINEKGSFNIQHNHPGNYFSAAYYVKVNENTGSINFFDPREQKIIRQPNIKKYTEMSAAKTSLKPQKGDLFLFPAYLYHDVSENLSDEERIIISFNLDIAS